METIYFAGLGTVWQSGGRDCRYQVGGSGRRGGVAAQPADHHSGNMYDAGLGGTQCKAHRWRDIVVRGMCCHGDIVNQEQY